MMKRKTYSRVLALVFAALLVFSLCAGCNSDTPDTSTPPTKSGESAPPQGGSTVGDASSFVRKTAEETLTIGFIEGVDSFDTATSFYRTGYYLVYDQLFTTDVETGEIVGLAAESWKYLDDCTLEIKIHEGITFADGSEMTTEDVLYSLERFVTTGSRWSNVFDKFNYEKSKIIDKYTLQLVTDEPYGPGLSYLAAHYSSIVSKNYVESQSDSAFWWDAPNGSGPYVVESNVAGSQTVFKLREDYWGEMPEAKTVTVKAYSEATTMFIDYENGDLDACFGISVSDADRLLAGSVPDTNWNIIPNNSNFCLVLPEYVEYFQDINVRKAIAMAVDWDVVADIALGVLATPANSTVQKGVKYQKDIGSYTYDAAAAKALLEEAGYKSGDITLKMVVINFNENMNMATAIQAYLEEVGIKMNVESYDLLTCVMMYMAGETDLVINTIDNGSLDPDQSYTTTAADSTNLSVRLLDETLNGYLDIGRSSVDEDVRREAYENVQQWMYDNYYQIPICDRLACAAYRPYISEFPMNSASSPNLRYVKFA